VMVVGGGLVGTETALFLSQQGKHVVLVEMLDDLVQDAGSLSRARLKEELKATEIDVRCGTRVSAIRDGSVTVVRNGEEDAIPAATIVLAVGARADDRLYRSLEGRVPELYAVGDCVAPRKMLEAIHEGYAIASKI